jgi:G3E family GTPase
LNPDARLIETDYGRVSSEAIFDTGLFDFQRAHQHPLWFKELYGAAEHVPEDSEYGITSFVWRAKRPFVPEKFNEFLETPLPGVIRAKGHFWLATRPDWVGEFSVAGAVASVSPLGHWWAAVPRPQWPDEQEILERMRAQMDPVFGDRRHELVFIGTLGTMNPGRISAMLDRCLAPGGRFSPEVWANLPDPLPPWPGIQAG